MKTWFSGSKNAPNGRFWAIYVNLSPSGSVAVMTNSMGWFSITVSVPMVLNTGGRFTSPTVIDTVSESLNGGTPLSVTVKMTLWLLLASASPGVQLNVCVSALNVAPLGRFPATNVNGSSSGSAAVIINVQGWFSVAVKFPRGLMTGDRFTLPTVMVTVSESLRGGVPLSVTVKMT